MFGLLFGMCRSHHAIKTRLHEERKAHKKLQKDMKEVKQPLYPNMTPSLFYNTSSRAAKG
jgi:hypothetical protein